MAQINGFNTNMDYSSLLPGLSSSAPANTFSISDYAAIKNGSYKKALKSYYAQQDEEKIVQSGDTPKKQEQVKSAAASLERSANALNNEALWEKKTIKKKDEVTGKEVEVQDYDWDAIIKAVKSFVEDYNNVIDEAGESDTKNVLRHTMWMTGMTEKTGSLLSKVGLDIGKGNKLKLDEKDLKEADISALKTIFTGYISFASKISQKAISIGNAADKAGGTYTKKGTYSSTLSSKISGKVDEEA